MNKVYFTAPLLALLVFAGGYAWSRHGAEERAAAVQAAAKAEHAARVAAEQEARRIALDDIARNQAELRKERAARAARDAAEREARALALDARDAAFRHQERLARDIERITRDIATEQEAVNRLQADFDGARAELEFLRDFLPQAHANAASLRRVLQEIAAAETARAKENATRPGNSRS